MWPDRVLDPEPLTYESGALPTALRGQAFFISHHTDSRFTRTVRNGPNNRIGLDSCNSLFPNLI